MRLIDADKLIEDLNNITLEMDLSQLQKLESVQQLIKSVTFNVHTIMMAHIDEQPTACDLDKVVEELEEKQQKWKTKLSESDTNYMDNAILKQYISHYDKAIEIVKRGGN